MVHLLGNLWSEVGDSAPDFNLVGVSGNELRLSDYKSKKNVILIFYADNS